MRKTSKTNKAKDVKLVTKKVTKKIKSHSQVEMKKTTKWAKDCSEIIRILLLNVT